MSTLTIRDPRSIERQPLTHVDDIAAQLRGEVLTKAHELFNYTADSFGAAGPLAATLVELGIAPLHTDQVEAYKKGKERDVTVNRRPWIVVMLIAVPLAFSIIATIYLWKDLGPLMLIPGAFVALFGSMIFDLGFKNVLPSQRRVWAWTIWALGTWIVTNHEYEVYMRSNAQRGPSPYPRYVPVHVLNLAVQIKTALPAAQFGVDELTLTVMDLPRPQSDPFLWVRLGGEKYYIAVWDEREYEAKA